MEKENILFFIADQFRGDALGCLGNSEVRTPHYDQLAQEGIAFENAFCQNPVCVPSRCSFNTGWYPHSKGHRSIHYFLDKGDPSMMKSLKKAGYHVYLMGKSHYFHREDEEELRETCDLEYIGREITVKDVHGDMKPLTKEEIAENPYYYSFYKGEMPKEKAKNTQDDLVIDKVVGLLESGQIQEPFCLYVSLNLPHPPYEIDEPWFSLIEREQMSLPTKKIEELKDKPATLYAIRKYQNLYQLTDQDFKEIKATYYGMIAKLDHQLGRVLSALKTAGHYDDTHILAFADHGDFTGDYGLVEKTQNTFEECLVHVPFLLRPSKKTAFTPRISKALVELNDIPATVAELCQYSLDYTQFGKSLVHLLNQEEEHHPYVLSEGGRIKGEKQVMEGYSSHTSIYWPRMESQNHLPDHTKAFMVRSHRYKYVYRLYETDEFYDLKHDPYEEHNAISQAQYQEIIAQMKQWLLQKLVETTDVVAMDSMLPGRVYGEE